MLMPLDQDAGPPWLLALLPRLPSPDPLSQGCWLLLCFFGERIYSKLRVAFEFNL